MSTLFTAFRFVVRLELDNPKQFGLPQLLCNAAFQEVDGLEMSVEPKTVREGGNNLQQINLVGPVSYSNMTLKRGMTSTLDLWNWFSVAAGSGDGKGRGARARGMVTMRDAAGNDVVHFKVSGCLPVSIKAPALNAVDGLLAIEEMQIAYTQFTIEPASE
jgi:phage tail-like protein